MRLMLGGCVLFVMLHTHRKKNTSALLQLKL